MAPGIPQKLRKLSIEDRNRPRHGGSRAGVLWQTLYILYCLEVGAFLLFLPWLSIWDNNFLTYQYPGIQPVVANPYLKGAVVGLGIVNLAIGIREIVDFRKGSRKGAER